MSQTIPRKPARGILGGTPEAKRRKLEIIDLTDDSILSWQNAKDSNAVIEIQDDLPSWSSTFKKAMASIARKVSSPMSAQASSPDPKSRTKASIVNTKFEPYSRDATDAVQIASPNRQEQGLKNKEDKSNASVSSVGLLSQKVESSNDRAPQLVEPSHRPLILPTPQESLERLVAQIWERTLAHRQALPPSRTILPHRMDFIDLNSPTLNFSFNLFVAKLRVDLIRTYLQSIPDHPDLLQQDFERQIAALYEASKTVEHENLIKSVESQFEDRLTSNVVYAVNMLRHADRENDVAKAKSDLATAQRDRVQFSGTIVLYLQRLSYPQLLTFSHYTMDLQLACLRTNDRNGGVPHNATSPGFRYTGHSRYSRHRLEASRPIANEDDFEKFLDELQEEDGDKDEGTNTAKEVAEAAEFLQAVALPTGKFSVPGLTCSLHPHQVIGIAWMSKRERQKEEDGSRSKVRGGLLADAMGLEFSCNASCRVREQKTYRVEPPETQATRDFDSLSRGTHTVNDSGSIFSGHADSASQWAREIGSKAPGFFANVRIHHGATKMKTVEELQKADVIITSYGTLAREYPVKKHKKVLNAQERFEDEERIERDKGPLFRIKFLRIILDEAHTIKNPAANVSVACCNVDAVRQWCLTGTPLQNKLDDIYPILKILRVPYFSDRPTFRRQISNTRDGAHKLRGVLAPFLKRRKKDDKIAGQQVLVLPEKKIKMTNLKLDESEQSLYQQVEAQMVSEINKYLLAGTAVKKINHIFVMVLRLRQLCIHPYLILEHLATNQGLDQAGSFGAIEDHYDLSKIIPGRLLGATDIAICGICFSEATDPMVSTKCWHCFCKACLKEIMENEESECPICSGPIGVLKEYNSEIHHLTPMAEREPWDHARSDAKVEEGEPEEFSGATMSCAASHSSTKNESDDDENVPALPCTPSRPTLISLMSESDDEDLPDLTIHTALAASHRAKSESTTPAKHRRLTSTADDIGLEDGYVSSSTTTPSRSTLGFRTTPRSSHTTRHTLSGLTPVREECKSGVVVSSTSRSTASSTVSTQRARYVADPADIEGEAPAGPTKGERRAEAESWQELLKRELLPSTKLTAVEHQLEEWLQQDDSKIIVFSQFVKALDLLDKACKQHGWEVLRYHGSMNMRERETTIAQFEESNGPRVLLMSLRAGGVGLNLVCASKVLLLDFWWNHACESQAIDRCHRMGQLREVMVIRTYFPGTIEEKILALQEEKLRTAGMVLGETEGGGKMAKLGLRELLSLFGRVTRNADGVQQIEAAH